MCQQDDSVYFLHSDGVLGIQIEDLVCHTTDPRVHLVIQKIWGMLTWSGFLSKNKWLLSN
jgi:hypothetical protein